MPGNTYPDHLLDHARAHGLTAPVPRLTVRRRLAIGLLMGALYVLAWALLLVHQLMRGVQWLRVRIASDIATVRHPAPTEPMGRGEFWANVAIVLVGAVPAASGAAMTARTESDYALLLTGLLLALWLASFVFVWDGSWSRAAPPCFPEEHMLRQHCPHACGGEPAS